MPDTTTANLIENLIARNAAEHKATQELVHLLLEEFDKMRGTLEKFVVLIERLEMASGEVDEASFERQLGAPK